LKVKFSITTIPKLPSHIKVSQKPTQNKDFISNQQPKTQSNIQQQATCKRGLQRYNNNRNKLNKMKTTNQSSLVSLRE